MRGLAAALALVLALPLAGCSAQDQYPATTSDSLQEKVLEISTLAADGSLDDALAQVDELTQLADSAHDDGTLPDDRYADITAAIDSVSTDLGDQIAAAQKAADDAAAADQAAQDALEEQAAQDAAEEDAETAPAETGPGKSDENKNKNKNKNKKGPKG